MKNTYIKLVLLAALALIGRFSFAAVSPDDSPLFLKYRVDPNVMIDLSIESPMIGAAYNDQPDTDPGGNCTGRPANESGYAIGTCYFKTRTYIGYFDPTKCYRYSTSDNRFNPVSGKTYVIGSSATCSGDWSGNFLNWATMTAIDEFRYAMTGGDRSSDTSTLTVLERASQTLGKGHSWFPVKKVGATVGPGFVATSTVTPYSDSKLYLYSHDDRLDVGTSTATNQKFTNRYVRTKVCDSTAGLETNCKAYGTSNKPEGLIQTNAHQLRFALVSYLADSNQSRDGGVLRSKMKYTGPYKYVAGTGLVSNANKEWRETDGTFITNPDPADASASGVSNSGVINYINKFGGSGYKSYDPAGELYYEALRYFKNLGPTPEYFSGLTSAMKDGFPVITTWDDPIQEWCQKNYIVGINDANPWLDKKLPGTFFTCAKAGTAGMPGSYTAGDCGEPSNPDTSINVTSLTNTVGALEGLNGVAWPNTGLWYSGTASGTNDTVGYFQGDANPGSCSVSKNIPALGEVMGTCPAPQKENSYYIAGLAYYANTTDIRGDLANKQTIATYMIDTQEYNSNPLDGPKNMLWLAGKYGGFEDTNGDGNPNSSLSGSATAEWDADGDGLPDNYVLATQPDKLVTGLQSAFSSILSKIGSGAALSANSTSLQTGTVVYQAKFNSADWSGTLLALPVDINGNVGAAVWDASQLIPPHGSRNIFTHNGTSGVAFSNCANLSAAQQLLLAQGGVSCADRLGWLRGDASDEQPTGNLRQRSTTVMADIINSDPAYVKGTDYGYGGLPLATPGQSTYAAFVSGNATRQAMVYVGTNGGLLEGINADTGVEVFAYVPAGVYGNLSSLTDPAYSHKYFVDGAPMVSDAYLSSGWRTVLAGGLNAGGKTVYALDVTNPTAFGSANVLWEFTDTNMGFSYSQPQIGILESGQWVAVFGNGYGSTEGGSYLYVVDLETGSLLKTIQAMDTPSVDDNNGLSTPVLFDSDGNGLIDVAYAGDLLGNMWKFDLSAPSSAGWAVALSGSPLYRACRDDDGDTVYCEPGTPNEWQPITSQPQVAKHALGGNFIIFGTGRYITFGDLSDPATQSFYGVLDDGINAIADRSHLLQQTVTLQTTAFGNDVRSVSTNSVNWASQWGWFLDLPDSPGERVVSKPLIKFNRAIFVTVIPSTDACSPGGDSWLMELDLMSGGAPPTSVFDFNNDDAFDSSDEVSGQVVAGIKSTVGISKTPVWLDKSTTISFKIMTGTSGGFMGPKNKGGGGGGGSVERVYWMQIR